ncbi:MAG: hypothetical protein K2X03_21185 [Bryobacteraceae bacterium]|nr:hypothetical protein [Bryobacteraceae bacterium]
MRNDALAELAGAEQQDEAIQLSEFQHRACCVPEDFNLALTGSRGGGKSFLMAILIMRHIVKFGDKARVLFVRQSHAGCEDFVMICRSLFGRVWGAAVRYNSQSGIWHGFPGGGSVEVSQLSNHGEYQKFQGRSFTLICVDEAGQFSTDELPSLLRSNLRGDLSVPKRMIVASNPCGVGHTWVYRKHVLRAVPWHPYETEDGQMWVTAPSLFVENPFIDAAQYRRDLEAACSFDGELLRAFRDGAWDVVRGGAFFGGSLDEKRVMLKAWDLGGKKIRAFLKPNVTPAGNGIVLCEPDLEPWTFSLALDWGYSAPCVCYLMAKSPGATVDGRWYPRGSVLVLDEVCTARPGQPHVGAELSVEDVSTLLKDMCRRWGVSPTGVCDDACGTRNDKGISIMEQFARAGVTFYAAGKGSRISGWQYMRELLLNASLERLDKPGLFVSDKCGYWWETVPFLSRSMRHPEDLDGICDHGADACRYGLVAWRSNSRPQRGF